MADERPAATNRAAGNRAAPDRMATDLLRLARHPSSGRVRGGGALDIGLRAALLCELVLDGRIVDDGRAPAIAHDRAAEPVGDHIADTLAVTVAKRPGVAWWRWYRHVRVDRAALIDELIDAGVWTRAGGAGAFARYEDVDPAYPIALGFELEGLLRTGDASQLRKSVLAVLKHLCGAGGSRSHPRALRGDLKGYVAQIRSGGRTAESALAAIAGSTVLMRRRTRR